MKGHMSKFLLTACAFGLKPMEFPALRIAMLGLLFGVGFIIIQTTPASADVTIVARREGWLAQNLQHNLKN
jgi:hypothetical protein